MVAAPNLWNNLPLEIREAPNIDNFKKLDKTFVFKKAFCCEASVASVAAVHNLNIKER